MPELSNASSHAGASTKTAGPKRRRRWIWLVAVLVVLAGAGGAWWRTRAPAAAAVATELVTVGPIEDAITAVGSLTPIRDVDVGAQVSGQLTRVHVAIGDTVKEGDLIAEIDPATVKNTIELDEAELANLKAQLEGKKAAQGLKQAVAQRQRALASSKGISQNDLDTAESELAVANADIASLEAQIRKQEAKLAGDRVDLAYTTIYAPMTGTVVDQTSKEGVTLNANQTAPTIVTLADLSTMTVEAQVSEADVGKLAPGMRAYFTLLGQPDRRFEGTLRQIKPTPDTDNNVILYYALFDVPNPDGKLMIDMSAQVHFVLGASDKAVLVPTAALSGIKASPDGMTATVRVLTEQGDVENRSVKLGIRNRVKAEVVDGLQAGERVIVAQASTTAATSTSERRGFGPPPMF